MDTGTPIINPGEVGIVALGTIRQKPWVVDGEVRAALRHDGRRVVRPPRGRRRRRDAAFIADVASILEEPALLLD